MAGYIDKLNEFTAKYNFKFSIEEHIKEKRVIGLFNRSAINVDYSNPKNEKYLDLLNSALEAYYSSRMDIDGSKTYSEKADMSIGDFIEEFDGIMQARYEESVKSKKAPAYLPFGGMSFSDVAVSAWDTASKYDDKHLADIWADKVIKDELSVSDIEKVLNPAMERLMNQGTKERVRSKWPWDPALTSDYANLTIATSALQRVVSRRTLWDRINPLNWWKNHCVNKLVARLQHAQAPCHNNFPWTGVIEDIENNAGSTLMKGVKENLRASVKKHIELEKEARKKAEEEAERKVLSVSEEPYHRLKETLSPEMKTAFETMDNRRTTNGAKDAVRDALKNVNMGAPILNSKTFSAVWLNSVQDGMTRTIAEMWENFDKTNDPAEKAQAMENGTKKLFTTAMSNLAQTMPKSQKELHIAAQKISDIYLKLYSPAAFHKEYAEYADMYFLKNAELSDLVNDNAKRLSNYREIATEKADLLTSIRADLQIEKPVELPDFDAIEAENRRLAQIAAEKDRKDREATAARKKAWEEAKKLEEEKAKQTKPEEAKPEEAKPIEGEVVDGDKVSITDSEDSKIEEPAVEETVEEETKTEEPAVEETVKEETKTEDAPKAEESEPMKLEAKENPFQHDVNRRKGKDRRPKARPPKPFNKKAEFSSANVIAEYENEDDMELDEPNELRSKEPMEDQISAGVNKRRAGMLKNISRIRRFPEEGFKKAFKLARDDGSLTEKVKAELTDALAKGKISEEYDIKDCVDKLFALVGRMEKMYMPYGVNAQKNAMNTYVYQMFDAVSGVTDLYDFESPEDRIIQSQKLTDVLLRNYPPISNANGRLDTYAHNYVVKSDILLTKFLSNMGALDHEIYGTTITGKGAVAPKVANPDIKPYDGTSLLASIRSKVAMEERAQVIASTPEAEQTGPMREQMEIAELAEQVGGKETSSKVEEPDAVSKGKTLD